MDTIRTLAGKAEWVWVDLFHGIHITPDEFREMKKLGYKICVVSPELQKHVVPSVEEYAKYFADNDIIPDAVCTKSWNIPLWQKHLMQPDFF